MAVSVLWHMVLIKPLLHRVHPCFHQSTFYQVIFMNWKHCYIHLLCVSVCYDSVQFFRLKSSAFAFLKNAECDEDADYF